MCSLRDAAESFAELGAKVFGISLDSVKDQAFFHQEKELNFPLLSDPDGSAARKYAVLPDQARYASRVTFVIDPKGVLRHVDRGVRVDSHGTDLVDLLIGLQEE